MKREFSLLICAALVLAVMTGLAPSQGPDKGEAPMGWPMGRMYDVKTVEIVKGEIVSVDVAGSGRMDIPGRVMLSVKTKTETVTAYLGPEWYVKEQGLKLAAGDQVEVKGSRVVMEGVERVIPFMSLYFHTIAADGSPFRSKEIRKVPDPFSGPAVDTRGLRPYRAASAGDTSRHEAP